MSTRQMRRLVKAYGRGGATALVSKRRGRRANHATSVELQTRAIALC
jgi:hypothetical protein